MNISEWLGSKKAKGFLSPSVLVAIVLVVITLISDGDAEKTKALMDIVGSHLWGIMGLGGTYVAGQSAVDYAKEAAKTRRRAKK